MLFFRIEKLKGLLSVSSILMMNLVCSSGSSFCYLEQDLGGMIVTPVSRSCLKGTVSAGCWQHLVDTGEGRSDDETLVLVLFVLAFHQNNNIPAKCH